MIMRLMEFTAQFPTNNTAGIFSGITDCKKSPLLVMAEMLNVSKPKKHRPVYRCKSFKMSVMDDLTAKTINRIVRNNLSPDSMVRTDNFWECSNHHLEDAFLLNYLDEFTYKLNRQHFGENLFDRLFVTCLSFNWQRGYLITGLPLKFSEMVVIFEKHAY